MERKERPILFSAPMVRSILAGTKTQTRRIVKPGPAGVPDPIDGYVFNGRALVREDDSSISVYPIRCPYYSEPGDRLWVRETWCQPFAPTRPDSTGADAGVIYRADGPEHLRPVERSHNWGAGAPWRPSIHMPCWASRITLEVTGVRVERLQDISEEGAVAEGIEPIVSEFGGWRWRHYGTKALHDEGYSAAWEFATNSYASLWDSINGAGSWDANPWVWVVEFRKAPNCMLWDETQTEARHQP